MSRDVRKQLNLGPVAADPRDLSQWSYEQIRVAGAWSKHEVQHTYDPLCEPYDYVPDWIGDMTPLEVNQAVLAWYKAKAEREVAS